MARQSAIQTSFNAGELSPRMFGRVDTDVYRMGVERMVGWFPALQGPAVAMPGTRYVEPAQGPFRNIAFEYDVTQSYVIEASAGKFRFYTNDVLIPGADIATPWTYEQILELDTWQSLDVLYLAHPATPPMQLRRLTATSFELVPLVLTGGPFDRGNGDETLTVTANGDEGAVTLTAPAGFFSPADAGSLFQIEAADYGSVPAWEPQVTINVGENRASAGKVYVAGATGRTGSVQPVHASGVEYDGMASGTYVDDEAAGGIPWLYKHNRFGVVRINAVAAGGGSATATVIQRLPTGYNSPNWRWARAAFSNRAGWPVAGTIWNERLILAKRAAIHGSVVAGYDDFSARDDAGDFQRDLAFRVELPNPNVIRWLAADRKMLIGTARAEHVAEQLIVQTGAAGPPVIQVDTQSTYGSRRTRPILADGRVLFIQRAGRKVHELGYSIQSDRYEAPDMTRLADHIGAYGFVELAWLQEPERQLWAVQRDGSLACMCYSPSQQVFGWSRRILGGGLKAQTICAITDPSGSRDQLWIGAQTPDGKWWQLRMEKAHENGDDPQAAYLVDAGLSYFGDPITNGSGLAHLAGQTITGMADGKPHRDIVVGADGSWSIDYPASRIHLGLAYPASIVTLPIEAGGEDGTAQGKKKAIKRVTLRVVETQGVRVSVQGLPFQTIESRKPADPLDRRVPLFTGDFAIDTGGDFEQGGRITIERFQPTPATIVAIIPTVETTGR